MAVTMFYSIAFIVITFASVQSLEKPEEITDEMYCLGCEVTVKELDFILSRKPTRGMGEAVTRALAKVCDIHNFNKYEFSSEKVLKVCKHIKDDEGMEAVLITEYGRKHATGKQTTYLDMTQMICRTVLEACKIPKHVEDFGEHGGITYDPDTEEFLVQQGMKVRKPNPVRLGTVPDVVPKEADVSSDPSRTKPVETPAKLTHGHDHQEL